MFGAKSRPNRYNATNRQVRDKCNLNTSTLSWEQNIQTFNKIQRGKRHCSEISWQFSQIIWTSLRWGKSESESRWDVGKIPFYRTASTAVKMKPGTSVNSTGCLQQIDWLTASPFTFPLSSEYIWLAWRFVWNLSDCLVLSDTALYQHSNAHL